MRIIRHAQLILAATVVALGLGVVAVPAYAQTAGNVSSASEGTVVPPDVLDTVVPPEVTVTTLPGEVSPEVQGAGADVAPEVQAAGANVGPEVLAEQVDNEGLAITGSDIAGLALLAVGLLAVGTALISVQRRRADV